MLVVSKIILLSSIIQKFALQFFRKFKSMCISRGRNCKLCSDKLAVAGKADVRERARAGAETGDAGGFLKDSCERCEDMFWGNKDRRFVKQMV